MPNPTPDEEAPQCDVCGQRLTTATGEVQLRDPYDPVPDAVVRLCWGCWQRERAQRRDDDA